MSHRLPIAHAVGAALLVLLLVGCTAPEAALQMVPPDSTAIPTISPGTWVSRADMPTGRWDLATCVLDGMIYAIGGAGPEHQALSTVELYDTARDTWITKSEMATARQGLSASVVGGRIYAIGGASSQDPGYASGEFYSTVEEYDPATDTWTSRSDMPTARGYHSANVIDGMIYVFGGTQHQNWRSGFVPTVEAYDPATDTWIQMGDMPTPRGAGSSSLVDGMIYVFGGSGRFGPGRLRENVDEYDPLADEWTVKCEMPTALELHTTTALDGKIYVIGGFATTVLGSPSLASVDVYDPATDTWTTVPDMPTARHGHSTQTVGGMIYVIGGIGHWPGPAYGTVEVLHPK